MSNGKKKGSLYKIALKYFQEINDNAEGPLPEEELEYRAEKLTEDVRRWLKARADFDPKEGEE